MAVFGGSDETYLARKLEKSAYYLRTFGRSVTLGRDGTKRVEKHPCVSACGSTDRLTGD